MRSMHIAPHIFSRITSQALIGARHDDPVLPERRRIARRRRRVPAV